MEQLLLRFLRALGVFALSAWLTRGQLRILCYHGIWIGPDPHFGNCLFMSEGLFRSRLEFLRRHGYRVHTLDEGLRLLREGNAISRDVVITIDDAWAGTGQHMLPALKAYGYPATLYVTTEHVLSQEPVWAVVINYLLEKARGKTGASVPARASGTPYVNWAQVADTLVHRVLARSPGQARRDELATICRELGIDISAATACGALNLMSPSALRQAHQDGFDLQLHSHSHYMPAADPARIRHEVQVNREALQDITQDAAKPLVHFCYPGGIYDPIMFGVLKELGIMTGTTTDTGLVKIGDSRLAMKRILDCESMSEIKLEAQLAGLWPLLEHGRSLARRLMRRRSLAGSPRVA